MVEAGRDLISGGSPNLGAGVRRGDRDGDRASRSGRCAGCAARRPPAVEHSPRPGSPSAWRQSNSRSADVEELEQRGEKLEQEIEGARDQVEETAGLDVESKDEPGDD